MFVFGTPFVTAQVDNFMKESMKTRFTIKNSNADEFINSSENRDNRFEIDPVEICRTMLRRRQWFISIVGATVAITILIMLLTPNRYTSRAVILPSGKTESMSALKAMAGLVGGMSMTDGTSSTLFPVVLRSHLIADSLLSKNYRFMHNGRDTVVNLKEYIGRDDSDRLYRGLAGMTSIGTDKLTGEITVSVETEYPAFSQLLTSEYISQLENYNLNSRKSQASERVRYLSHELSSRFDSLTEAENALATFQQNNRNWAGTSDAYILKQLGRLKRDVEIKTKTYGYLLQEYEIARLDAQKDIPIVRVLDSASLPTQKSGPFRSITVIASGFISFMIVAFMIFLLELIQNGIRTTDKRKIDALQNELREAMPFVRINSSMLSDGADRADEDKVSQNV